MRVRVGIITGSGTYALPGLEDQSTERVATPFGDVEVTAGRLSGVEVLHVSRHQAGHVRVSNHVTHQANVLALVAHGADALLAVTVCGSLEHALAPGSLLVFDELHFPSNRLPDGSLCTLHVEPGAAGRGHWIFEQPFAPALRAALLDGARAAGHAVRDSGCYGHVDGPRFNTRSEIRQLQQAGVSAVSQTAGPEAVLAGEAGLPFALLGYATDYANGVNPEAPTPVAELLRLIGVSGEVLATTLAAAVTRIDAAALAPVGTRFTWD